MNFDNCATFLYHVIKEIYKKTSLNCKVHSNNLSILNLEFKKNIQKITCWHNIIVFVDELENLLNKDKKSFDFIIEFFNIHC